MTRPPAVTQEVDVKLEFLPARRELEHGVVELLERRTLAEQAEAGADAADVGVDGDVAHAVGEQQDARRGLATHSREGDELVALPGVGRKTAACVLLFAYGMRDIPVDTHVSRVGTRLGLFREGAPFEELHDAMLDLTPKGQELEFHVNLLRHGRRTCHSRRPKCDECALLRLCPTGYNLRQAD